MKTCPKCNIAHSEKGIYCSRSCANSRSWSEKDRLKKSIASRNSSKVRRAQMLKRERFPIRRTNKCCICQVEFQVRNCQKTKQYCSRECYKNDINFLGRKKKSGGLRKGAGRGKSGWYKGYWCDSSYELAWVIYNLDHNVKFERNKLGYEYEYEGKRLKYYPDFICDNELIEIKGFNTKQFEEKKKVVANLKVLYRKDLVKEFGYVQEKYGKNFIQLYE